jgi:hypothetical protein
MVDNLSLKVIKARQISSEKPTIIDKFYSYCSYAFGPDQWKVFMQNEEFRKMIEDYEPRYGDTIFSVIADVVCENQGITIRELIADFSNFIISY